MRHKTNGTKANGTKQQLDKSRAEVQWDVRINRTQDWQVMGQWKTEPIGFRTLTIYYLVTMRHSPDSDSDRTNFRLILLSPITAAEQGCFFNVVDKSSRLGVCPCGRANAYDAMIACDNPQCEIEWYHFTCVGVTKVPKDEWFCPFCSKGKMEVLTEAPFT